MVLNCFSTPLSAMSLMPKRGGIIGKRLNAHAFHWSV
jgi:hypothetical protein